MTARRRTLYLLLIGLGGAALGVDRLLLTPSVSGPVEAEGSTGPASSPAGTVTLSDPRSAEPIPALVFPGPLPPPGDRMLVRDVFEAPEQAFFAVASRTATDKNAPDKTDSTSAEPRSFSDFAEQHRLTGVLIRDRLRIAIVDGQWVMPGQAMDSCSLLTVSGIDAAFQCHDGVAVLRVADTPSPTPD